MFTLTLVVLASYPVILVIKLLMRLRIYLELLIEKEEAAADARDQQDG